MMIPTILTLCLLLPLSWAAPMHQQPPLAKAVCDKPNYLIFAETGWCFAPDTQVYLVIADSENIASWKLFFPLSFPNNFYSMNSTFNFDISGPMQNWWDIQALRCWQYWGMQVGTNSVCNLLMKLSFQNTFRNMRQIPILLPFYYFYWEIVLCHYTISAHKNVVWKIVFNKTIGRKCADFTCFIEKHPNVWYLNVTFNIL